MFRTAKPPHKQPALTQRIKYLSLGLQVARPRPSNDQLVQRMIDLNACISEGNQKDVLLTEFDQALDSEGAVKENRLYEYYLGRVTQHSEEDDVRSSKGGRAHTVSTIEQGRRRAGRPGAAECMSVVYDQAHRREQMRRYRAAKIDKQLERLYADSHELYTQLMEANHTLQGEHERLRELHMPATRRWRKSLSRVKVELQQQEGKQEHNPEAEQQQLEPVPSIVYEQTEIIKQCNQKIQYLNQKIALVKVQIASCENQRKKMLQESRETKEQKVDYLKLLLRNGHRQIDGITWLLTKLAENEVKLSTADLYTELSTRVKSYILEWYQCIAQQLQQQQSKLFPKLKTKTQPDITGPNPPHSLERSQEQSNPLSRYDTIAVPSLVPLRFRDIPQAQSPLRIYQRTQQFLVGWVRRESWKQKPSPMHKLQAASKNRQHLMQALKEMRKYFSKEEYEGILVYLYGSPKNVASQQLRANVLMRETRRDARKESYYSNSKTYSRGSEDPIRNSVRDEDLVLPEVIDKRKSHF